MKGIGKWYHNLPIFYKILICTLVISMIPLCIMVSFAFSRILSIENAHCRSEILNGLAWIENDVMQEIDELRLQGIKVSMDDKIRSELSKEGEADEIDLYELNKGLYDIALSGSCHSAYIADMDGRQVSNYNSSELSADIEQLLPEFQEKLKNTKRLYVWGEPVKYGSVYLLPYIRFIRNTDNTEQMGLLIANYPENRLESITRDLMSDKKTQVENVMIVSDGVVFSSWEKELIGSSLREVTEGKAEEGTFDADYNGENCMFLSYMNESSSDWKYIAVISYWEMHEASRSVLLLFALISLICAAFIFLASYMVSRSISKPLEYLSGAMRDIGDHDLNIQLKKPDYQDEVGRMWNSFIHMKEMLKISVGESQRALEQNQRLRIEALKAQINPHFLYNTFGSIIYLIEEGKGKDAAEMLSALSELLHISISRSTEYIPVEQELGLVRRYMDIQKIRYQNSFRYLIDVDLDIMKLHIVKIILQPVIENVLEHGLKMRPGRNVLIQVRGWKEKELLIFEIIDDCGTLSVRRMNEVNAMLRSAEPAPEAKTGIGLKNVNDRVRYAYPGDQRLGVCLLIRGERTVTRITLKAREELQDGYMRADDL